MADVIEQQRATVECERVTACCGEDDRFTLEGECPCGQPTGVEGYKCKQHGEVWPDAGGPHSEKEGAQ